jgi:hypothetical protein
VLLTRAPLVSAPKGLLPFDLHVLSTPPAFVLSQDQTLRRKFKTNILIPVIIDGSHNLLVHVQLKLLAVSEVKDSIQQRMTRHVHSSSKNH